MFAVITSLDDRHELEVYEVPIFLLVPVTGTAIVVGVTEVDRLAAHVLQKLAIERVLPSGRVLSRCGISGPV